MIIRKDFSSKKVVSYVKTELSVALLSSMVCYGLYYFNIKLFQIPLSIATILGSALAIFIAFRNNNSYSRWWEARTIWSSISNASKVYARLIVTFTNSHSNSEKHSQKLSEDFKSEMINLIIAWSILLKNQLREIDDLPKIKKYVQETEYNKIANAHNKLNAIFLIIGNKLYQTMNSGILAGFYSFQIENQLLILQNSQGSLERIKGTPLLRQYHYFTKLFLFVFIILLPFSLLPEFVKLGYPVLVIPFSVIIAFVYSIIAKVGEVNEDPFENKITDVPMDYITNSIERDLLEALGEKELPEKVKSKDGYIN